MKCICSEVIISYFDIQCLSRGYHAIFQLILSLIPAIIHETNPYPHDPDDARPRARKYAE